MRTGATWAGLAALTSVGCVETNATEPWSGASPRHAATSGGEQAASGVRAADVITTRGNRITPAGMCADMNATIVQRTTGWRVALDPVAIRGQRTTAQDEWTDRLDGLDCTQSATSAGIPTETEFTVRTATRTVNGAVETVFGPGAVIRIELTESDDVRPRVMVGDHSASDFELRFLQRFLMTSQVFSRPLLADGPHAVGVAQPVAMQMRAEVPFADPSEYPVVEYPASATISRVGRVDRLRAYEVLVQGRTASYSRNNGANRQQFSGSRRIRSVYPVRVDENELERDDTLQWSVSGEQTEDGVRFRYEWSRSSEMRMRFSRWFSAPAWRVRPATTL